MEYVEISVIECNQPKCVKRKLRGYKVRSDVYWGGTLEKKCVKQGICVLRGISVSVWA